MKTTVDKEAEVFCYYLVKADANASLKERYIQIIKDRPGSPSTIEIKLLNFALKHTRLVGMLDGGLAVLRPQAELRRRIYIMFAILETMPEHSDKFLPKKRSPVYIIVAALLGMRAIFRALCGIVIIKTLELRS